MNYVKTDYEKKWLLAFYHIINDGIPIFSSIEEVKYINEENRYSILGELDERFQQRGRYEFLLEYPAFQGCNIWTQTISPLYAQPNHDNGYKAINITWDDNNWHGLSLSSSESTFIDGSPGHNFWFYSIGLRKPWNEKSIPGPYDTNHYPYNNSIYNIYEVYLWLRIDHQRLSLKLKLNLSMNKFTYIFILMK